MDALTAIIELASNSICAVLVIVVLLHQMHHHENSNRQRDEIERMIREMHARNGRNGEEQQ